MQMQDLEPVRPPTGQTVYALGFSRWKRQPLRVCLSGCRVVFVHHASQIPQGAWVVVWGMFPREQLPMAGHVLRVEDGFLRSVGLGADLTWPMSWVLDGRGMYFDARQPSDLEVILQHGEFAPPLLARAAALRERIVSLGLTKYNVGHGQWQRPAGRRRVVLVPGQVESDASLTFGGAHVRTNMALLQAVRCAAPDAYVIYKPHPDVVAGMRARGQGEDTALRWCDAVVTDVPMAQLLQQVDEVHVLTSLAGFEALLRNRKVVCYGLPFYAGWGLTQDVVPMERRSRSLSLDALVAGALIVYPRYMSRQLLRLQEPEQALDELQRWRDVAAGKSIWWLGVWRWLLRRVVGVR